MKWTLIAMWMAWACASCLGEPMESNLAKLNESTPGASRAVVWTREEMEIDVPALARASGAAAIPENAVAAGVVWPIAHVVDRVKLVYSGAVLEQQASNLQVFDGKKWVYVTDGLRAKLDEDSIELSFEPVATRMIRVAAGARSGLARLEVHRYQAEAAKPTWPARLVNGSLDKQFLTSADEPSFESLSLHALSMPTWAMTGLKDLGDEQAVAWDGQIHCQGRRISIALGEPARHLPDVRETIRRRLFDNWMPAVIVEAQLGSIGFTQTSFAVFCGDDQQSKPVLWARMELANLSDVPFAGPLRIQLTDAPADPFEGTLGVDLFNPPADKSPSRWDVKNGVLSRSGQPFVIAVSSAATGKDAELVFNLKLSRGEKTTIDFVVPSPMWKLAQGDVEKIRALQFEKMFARFREYWMTLLAPAMKLDLPEQRLCDLHRAVIAQLFINAYGDKMPYGAAPSNYDGSVYGVEEAYAIFALATSGYFADAQRYIDATHLQKQLLAKAEKFTDGKDRNQQNHNGLKPMFAAELFKLTRNRAWIHRHLSTLNECAEWTISNRKKTMQLVDGKKPAHFGLLPIWAYGGDIHEACYPLFPNFCCWRGLHDTARLNRELGDHATADRFQKEADDYRNTLLELVDAIYRKNASPPFLPLRTDAQTPDSEDFYQLFAGLMMDLMPFDFSDPRSNYLGDFLDRDNRTLCLLPRFRRNDQAGGIDAIYGMGHILSRLHQNKIREFLLGFYAYQAFNMEHACFTSREQNRVYSSDLHLRSSVPVMDWSDPLPCSSAVAVLLLRHLLVTEESKGAAEYTGKLLLLYGAPRKWFARDEKIAVTGAPTHAGTISFAVTINADASQLHAEIDASKLDCPAIKIRLRHPDGKLMNSVTVNGKAITTFDARDELVEVLKPSGKVFIDAKY